MSTNSVKYKIHKITCEDDSCQKEFSVIVDPIYTMVTRPSAEIELDAQRVDVTKEGLINDYIVVKCPCGNSQRIYLKINKDE